MTEKRQSVWTVHWKGWRGLAGWFVILFGAVFLTLIALGLASKSHNTRIADIVIPSLLLALVVAGIVTPLIRLTHWMCCWRNFRRFLFGAACVATLVALFYAEENIRGKLAWNRYVKERATKGDEVKDIVAMAPPPIPDEQNFAAAHVFRTMLNQFDSEWLRSSPRPVTFDPDQLPSGPHRADLTGSMADLRTWRLGLKTDLAAWQAYYRSLPGKPVEEWETPVEFPVPEFAQTPAADVLLALSVYDQGLEGFRTAATRPLSRFPVHYEDGFAALLPHAGRLRNCNKTLALKAVAELAEGRTDAALADVTLSLRLIESLQTEPMLISHLVRISMFTTTLQPIWEGLADHAWTDPQLNHLEDQLKQLDFLADWPSSVMGERAFSIWTADHLRQTREMGLFEPGDTWIPDRLPRPVQVALFRITPGGWFEQNKLHCSRTLTADIAPLIDPSARRVDFARYRQVEKELDYMKSHRTADSFLVSLLVPSVKNSAKNFAHGQTCLDLARTACALERYRLAEGEHPETLDALSPGFLETVPRDVVTGSPLKYGRLPDHSYVLYSIGWNEQDDNGKPGGVEKLDEGDWVWRYPEK